jgi:thioredoxin reductase
MRATSTQTNALVAPVAIIGAGPVGLAAAAHLLERGLDVVVFESAADIAGSMRSWGHVRLFSPWRYNVDRAAADLLAATGWTAPSSEELPTGRELIDHYLAPLSALPVIRDRLRLGRRVEAVTRFAMDKVRTAKREQVPFLLRTRDAHGVQEEWLASAVIDASGTWTCPNPVGAMGLPALGEEKLAARITYGIPDILGADPDRFANRATMVIGAGHSAANSILALVELAATHPQTEIAWVTRGSNLARVFGGGAADALPARGALGATLRGLVDAGRVTMVDEFRITSLQDEGGLIDVRGVRAGEGVALSGFDEIIAATGNRPDLSITRELRLSLDPSLESVTALAPLIDPNHHSCGTVRPHSAQELAHPEPGFFTIGSKSYGRAPTFLLATGYEQARSVAAMIAGDFEAAARVELDLPETGVCGVSFAGADNSAAACCS